MGELMKKDEIPSGEADAITTVVVTDDVTKPAHVADERNLQTEETHAAHIELDAVVLKEIAPHAVTPHTHGPQDFEVASASVTPQSGPRVRTGSTGSGSPFQP